MMNTLATMVLVGTLPATVTFVAWRTRREEKCSWYAAFDQSLSGVAEVFRFEAKRREKRG